MPSFHIGRAAILNVAFLTEMLGGSGYMLNRIFLDAEPRYERHNENCCWKRLCVAQRAIKRYDLKDCLRIALVASARLIESDH